MAEPVTHIFEGKDGKRRLRVAGRRGWPLTMLDGETVEETIARYDAKKAERDAVRLGYDPLNSPAGSNVKSFPGVQRSPGESGDGPAVGAVPPPPRDPAPKTAKARQTGASGKSHPTTLELEKVLAELLVMPAVPAKMVLDCDYCTQHFAKQGPQAAHELAVMSESNQALRDLLERLHGAMTAITWASILGGYVAKPLVHHLAPATIRENAGPFIGVPLNRRDIERIAAEKAREERQRAAEPQSAEPSADTSSAAA